MNFYIQLEYAKKTRQQKKVPYLVCSYIVLATYNYRVQAKNPMKMHAVDSVIRKDTLCYWIFPGVFTKFSHLLSKLFLRVLSFHNLTLESNG